MIIKKIRLENWLSHVDTTLEFQPLTGLRGENGSGKTSVESALEMTFAGRNVQTDDKGSGMRELVRRGADKAVITTEFEDEGRTIRMRCSITEKSGRTIVIKDPKDETWTGGDYLTNLTAKREILDCLINGRYFSEMADARQKELLAGILLPATVTVDDWVKAALTECSLKVDYSARAFDLITSAFDKCKEERKLINRLVKEWKEPESPPATVPDLRAIRDRLRERQNQRTEIALQKQKVLDKFEHSQQTRTRNSGRAVELQGRLTTEVQRRAQVAQGELSKARLKEAEETAKRLDAVKALDLKITETSAALAEVRRTMAKFNDLGEAGTCPTCTQPVTDEVFERIATPFLERQNTLITDEQRFQRERKDLGDPEGAQRTLDAHNQAIKDLALIDEKIKSIENDIHEIVDGGTETTPTPPDTSEFDAQLRDIDERIAKGNAGLAEAMAAEAKKTAHDAAIESKKKLDAKQASLDKLCDYFGPKPKGIQAKLLDEHVGPFQESMNKVLAGWNFRCELQFEPFSFRAGLAGSGECFALRAMSAGQRAMFAVAFQVALAKVSGFKIVFIDDAEVFSEQNRVTLFKNLLGAGLDQAFVLAADVKRNIPLDQSGQPRAGMVFYLFTLDRSGAVPTTKVERLTATT